MTVLTSPSGLSLCDTCVDPLDQLLNLTKPILPDCCDNFQSATLPVSPNAISACAINIEIRCSSQCTRSLNDPVTRRLAGLTTNCSQISYSDFWGKSWRTCFTTYTASGIASGITPQCIVISSLYQYCCGKTTLTVCVGPNVVMGSCNGYFFPSLGIYDTYPGDCIIIYNSGNILGNGGFGGGPDSYNNSTGLFCGYEGYPAIYVKGVSTTMGCTSVTIYNYGHIWGGGGGGGGSSTAGGGGGAGVFGGWGGNGQFYCGGRFVPSYRGFGGCNWGYCGDTAAGPGLCAGYCGGGGGGGGGSQKYSTTGGTSVPSFTGLGAGAIGGWAGGGGGQSYNQVFTYCLGGCGGGYDSPAGGGASGGGGNWGAYGGYAFASNSPGGLPGPAVCLNGSVNLNWGYMGNIRGPVCSSRCLS